MDEDEVGIEVEEATETLDVATDPAETIDYLDEAVQRRFDQEVVAATIQKIRSMLAQTKVNYALANAGLQEKQQDMHPEKLRKALKDQRRALDLMISLAEDMPEHGIPEPSSLEVAVDMDPALLDRIKAGT